MKKQSLFLLTLLVLGACNGKSSSSSGGGSTPVEKENIINLNTNPRCSEDFIADFHDLQDYAKHEFEVRGISPDNDLKDPVYAELRNDLLNRCDVIIANHNIKKCDVIDRQNDLIITYSASLSSTKCNIEVDEKKYSEELEKEKKLQQAREEEVLKNKKKADEGLKSEKEKIKPQKTMTIDLDASIKGIQIVGNWYVISSDGERDLLTERVALNKAEQLLSDFSSSNYIEEHVIGKGDEEFWDVLKITKTSIRLVNKFHNKNELIANSSNGIYKIKSTFGFLAANNTLKCKFTLSKDQKGLLKACIYKDLFSENWCYQTENYRKIKNESQKKK